MRNLEALVLWTARGQRGKVREEGGVQSLRGRRRHSLQNNHTKIVKNGRET